MGLKSVIIKLFTTKTMMKGLTVMPPDIEQQHDVLDIRCIDINHSPAKHFFGERGITV